MKAFMEDVCEGKDFNFAQQEEKILAFWRHIDAFHRQLSLSEQKPEFVFYDGPPFATGLPHHGHILAGTIKDIVTRFQTANGRHVTRRFGWDCHGLPVEYEINQTLGIRSKKDVLDMGIDLYNEECRKIVMRYSKEWQKVVTRLGRWIDFENDYKTLDPAYMESIWWVFKQLYEKGLVYRGFKVMPYSIACNTALSNFEAGLNYQDVSDPSIMVSFPLLGDEDGASMVAWTTTPWTLPSNVSLCVHPNLTYAKVLCNATGAVYIVAETCISQLPTPKDKEERANGGAAKSNDGRNKNVHSSENNSEINGYAIIARYVGADLTGKRYKPLFEYFPDLSSVAFKILADEYVKDNSGTDRVPDFMGSLVMDTSTNMKIIAAIKEKGRLVDKRTINHSYPHCWRSDTRLIYKALPSWFVGVEKIKEKLLNNNKETYWVPGCIKEKRFHNWLENARDWAVSRTRFWGTPLPIWRSSDGKEVVVIGSVTELEELSGCKKVTDLHRHRIDDIAIPSRRGPEYGVLRRVEDVFDCWFESGSMPYAYIHYPFENRDLFEHNFPGDFVAEGLDQTRGWFYTLMVLSTAIFNKPAFKNLICNGLVLAEDGKKMSKRLKNYPDPMVIADKHGADALRLYLINSPVVRGECLRFRENGVSAVVKDVLLPWYNAYRFLVQNTIRFSSKGRTAFIPLEYNVVLTSANVLDEWINSASSSLVKFVREEMDSYRLYTVVPYLLKFIDNLTNIYVRFNRRRLKGETEITDCQMALSTLYHVLLTTCKVMAPFTPFFTEVLYQNFKKLVKYLRQDEEESIHFCSFPSVEGKINERIEKSVVRMMAVIDLARNIRERHKIALKTPLRKMVVVHPDEDFLDDVTGKLGKYVQDELNVQLLLRCNDPLKYATLRAEPDYCVLGRKLGKEMGAIAKEVKSMSQNDILQFEKSGGRVFCGHHLSIGDIKVIREFKAPDDDKKGEIDASGDGDVLVVLELTLDDTLKDLGTAREIVNRAQKLRKKAGLEPTDRVEVLYKLLKLSYGTEMLKLQRVFKTQETYMEELLKCPVRCADIDPADAVVLGSEEFTGIADGTFQIILIKSSVG